jgi:hypothetical protein
MLPVPTVCAISNGEASKAATANLATKRPAKLQFKIVNLRFGLFTELLLSSRFKNSEAGSAIAVRWDEKLRISTRCEQHELKSNYPRTQVDAWDGEAFR